MPLPPTQIKLLKKRNDDLYNSISDYPNLEGNSIKPIRYKGKFTGAYKVTDIEAVFGDPDSLRALADDIEILREAKKQFASQVT